MNSVDGQQQRTPDESHFAALLSAYHESLLSGASTTAQRAEEVDAPLVSAAACVELLERLRRDACWAGEAVAHWGVPQDVPDPGQQGPAAGQDASGGSASLGRLGRFEVRRELGRGGHGIVFLVYDPALDREVALKIPRPEVLASDDLRQRFLREGKSAATLDHPNLVPVYEAGQAGPICYIASAFAPGATLAEWLARRETAVPARTAAAIVACLAEAVEYMHSRNVLHRDLKPANVLLDAEPNVDGRGTSALDEAWVNRARLTDFGLAKALDSCIDQTQSTVLAGTPAYIAPEQVALGTSEIGRRTDVYGLGVILYETLTGRPPFQGATVLDTLYQVLTVEPPSPRSAKHSRWKPDVPRNLETICIKAIAREPEARYATAGELAADLQRFLDGLPVRARPVGPLEALYRWCRRRPLVATLSTAMAVSVLVGMTAVLWQWRRAEINRSDAESNLRETRGVVDHYFTRISENKLLEQPALQSLRRELLNDAVNYYREFIARHGDDPELREELASAYFRLGSVTWEIGSVEEARAAHQAGLQLRRELVRERPDDPQLRRALAESCYDLGILAREGGDSVQALQFHEEAYRIRAELLRDNPRDVVLQHDLGWSCNNIGLAANDLAHVQDALDAYGQARDIFERLSAADPADDELRGDLAVTLNRYGLLYNSLARHTDALQMHRQALEVLGGPDDGRSESNSMRRERAATHRHIGNALRLLDLHDPEAARSFERAVEICVQLVSDNPAVVRYQGELGEALFGLGSARYSLGEFEAALDAFEQACDVRETIVATTPNVAIHEFRLAMAHHYAGDTLRLLMRPTEAVPHFERAGETCESLATRYPSTVKYQVQLGSSCFALGAAQESAGQTARAVQSFEGANDAFQALLDRTGDETEYRSWQTASRQALARLQVVLEAGS